MSFDDQLKKAKLNLDANEAAAKQREAAESQKKQQAKDAEENGYRLLEDFAQQEIVPLLNNVNQVFASEKGTISSARLRRSIRNIEKKGLFGLRDETTWTEKQAIAVTLRWNEWGEWPESRYGGGTYGANDLVIEIDDEEVALTKHKERTWGSENEYRVPFLRKDRNWRVGLEKAITGTLERGECAWEGSWDHTP